MDGYGASLGQHPAAAPTGPLPASAFGAAAPPHRPTGNKVTHVGSGLAFPAAVSASAVPLFSDNSSPMTGAGGADEAHTAPPSPVDLLDETIASKEFLAQLEAARAAERISCARDELCAASPAASPAAGAGGGGGWGGVIEPSSPAAVLDALIASQIEIEKRRRRGPGREGGGGRGVGVAGGRGVGVAGGGGAGGAAGRSACAGPGRGRRGPKPGGRAAGAAAPAGWRAGAAHRPAPGPLPRLAAVPGVAGVAVARAGAGGPCDAAGRGDKLFQCDKCAKVFERKYNLKVHMRRWAARRSPTVPAAAQCV